MAADCFTSPGSWDMPANDNPAPSTPELDMLWALFLHDVETNPRPASTFTSSPADSRGRW